MKKLFATLLFVLLSASTLEAQQFSAAQRNSILRMIKEYLGNGNTFGGGGAGNPAGAEGNVQYNTAGAFGAEAAFSYNAATDTLSAVNFSGALLGNALTASALFANPAACAANRYVTDTDANGTLTCAQVNLAAGVTGNLPPANLNNGTAADATTFWRGDGTWAVPAGGGGGAGDLTEVQGTPNEIAVTSGTGPIPVVGLAASIDLTAKALRLPLSSDPGGPSTGQVWINGADLKYRSNEGSPATKTVLTAEADTLDTVADRSPKTTGRTCSSPFEIEGNTSGTLIRACDDPTLGLIVEPVVANVLGAVSKRVWINDTFDWCVGPRTGLSCKLKVDPANGVTQATGLTSGFSFPLKRTGGLADTDDLNVGIRIPFAQTITQVCARTDTGTSTINIQRDDGSAANILSSNLTAATTEACTTTFVSGENILSAGHYVKLIVVTAAASGTPVELTVSAVTTRN